jgi:hypothetical protein
MSTTTAQAQVSIIKVTAVTDLIVVEGIYTPSSGGNNQNNQCVNFNKELQIYSIEQMYTMPDWFYQAAPTYSAHLSDIRVSFHEGKLQQFEKRYKLKNPDWQLTVTDSTGWEYSYNLGDSKQISKCSLIQIKHDINGICHVEMVASSHEDMPLFASAVFDVIELLDLQNALHEIEIPDIFSGTLFTLSNR